MNSRASGASELRKSLHLLILKLLFPSIFCWYFRYFVSETFSGLQLHLHIYTYTINAVSFDYLWYGTINDSRGDRVYSCYNFHVFKHIMQTKRARLIIFPYDKINTSSYQNQ